jgi:plasmid stabilization system protein ParE
MSYHLDWTFSALNSYYEEIEFIYLKWNQNEVLNFEKLVEKELERLSKNPEIGTFNKKFKVFTVVIKNNYSIAISKQTTLIYRINDKVKSIELLLFWNNLKNPEDLNKLL